MKQRNKTLRAFLAASVLAIVFSGCGGSDSVEGRWQLDEFCYGDDCINMQSHGFNQVWDFNDQKASDASKGWKTGHQFQEEVMDQDIVWTVSAEKDKLYIKNVGGEAVDTHSIARMTGDSLTLTSTINNIQVRQHFTRAKSK